MATTRAKATASPQSWPGTKEAARRLDVSVRTLRRREEAGLLHPIIDDDGHRRYDPAELARLAPVAEPAEPPVAQGPPAAGALAAKVFRRMGEGADPRELVTEFERLPEEIAHLVRQWTAMGPNLLITPADQRALRNAGLGAFRDTAGLVAAVLELANELQSVPRFFYPCNICGRPCQLRDAEWEVILRGESILHWAHVSCVESQDYR